MDHESGPAGQNEENSPDFMRLSAFLESLYLQF